jgi:hypothetical protein
MEKLTIFINRVKRLGITIEFFGNYPWIYIDRINGKRVTEKFEANHGFTIGYAPSKPGQEFNFTNIGEIFRLIRKYAALAEVV